MWDCNGGIGVYIRKGCDGQVGLAYGSSNTNEYGGFLLVFLRLLLSSDYDWKEVKEIMRIENNISSNNTIYNIWKG